MATYVMLTRLSPEALTRPETVAELNEMVESHVRSECPEVKWVSNYALMGPYDYMDIFEAPDNDAAGKVALIVRSFGHAVTETWGATPWDKFVDMATHLQGRISVSRT